ncbi:MAG: ribonuclease P protein component [Eubacterium sp.]|nr:ribonuclease P protein component [Eubacterium sp.]
MSFEKLGNNQEFQKVYKKGRSRANKYLVMYVVKGQSGPCRYGFSVSKKVGNSVRRHRITRLLRETVRKYDARVTEGCRIIIIARPTVAEQGLNEISEAVKNLYKAHHIWKEP